MMISSVQSHNLDGHLGTTADISKKLATPLKVWLKEPREIPLSGQRKTKVLLISPRRSAAGLHLCFMHVHKGGFLMTWLIYC